MNRDYSVVVSVSSHHSTALVCLLFEKYANVKETVQPRLASA